MEKLDYTAFWLSCLQECFAHVEVKQREWGGKKCWWPNVPELLLFRSIYIYPVIQLLEFSLYSVRCSSKLPVNPPHSHLFGVCYLQPNDPWLNNFPTLFYYFRGYDRLSNLSWVLLLSTLSFQQYVTIYCSSQKVIYFVWVLAI